MFKIPSFGNLSSHLFAIGLTTLFIFLLTSWSCQTTKRLGPIPSRTKEEVISALEKRNIDFQWFSAKASTSIESPEENISGTLLVRMKSDSLLWTVVKKFGIEAARLLADKEKYTVIYRFESAYEVWPIDHLKSYIRTDAEFADIQQLLFGNTIIPEVSTSELVKDSISYVLISSSGDLNIKYHVNAYTMELEKMELSDKRGRTASAIYSDYRLIDKYGKYSFHRKFTFPYPSGEYATITMELSDVEINVPKEINFSIPSHYERIN